MKMPKMPNVGKMFGKLCNPAKLYLVLSLISVVIYIVSMLDYGDKLKSIHNKDVDTESHTYMGLLMQIVLVLSLIHI